MRLTLENVALLVRREALNEKGWKAAGPQSVIAMLEQLSHTGTYVTSPPDAKGMVSYQWNICALQRQRPTGTYLLFNFNANQIHVLHEGRLISATAGKLNLTTVARYVLEVSVKP